MTNQYIFQIPKIEIEKVILSFIGPFSDSLMTQCANDTIHIENMKIGRKEEIAF